MEGGAVPAPPPQFAVTVGDSVVPYLRALRLNHTYRFISNRPGLPDVRIEVHLTDAQGKKQVLQFPDPKANYWVRYRQLMLARELAGDEPVMPQQGEKIPAPGRKVPRVKYWHGEGRKLAIREEPEDVVPKDRPVMRPSDWSLLLARACARHLCRAHGASSAELIRYTRVAVPPAILRGENPQPDAFEDLICNFGELSK
jgi:hypothetical protein